MIKIQIERRNRLEKIDIHQNAIINIKENNQIKPLLFKILNIRRINDTMIRQNILNNTNSLLYLMFTFSWTC